MQELKIYIYPLIIVVLVVAFGGLYMFVIQEGADPAVVEDSHQILNEYTQRIEKIEGLRLETDILEGDIYLSLTDEYEEEVVEVNIGRTNPFRPL